MCTFRYLEIPFFIYSANYGHRINRAVSIIQQYGTCKMRSFLADIVDSTLTWTSADDISISSTSSSDEESFTSEESEADRDHAVVAEIEGDDDDNDDLPDLVPPLGHVEQIEPQRELPAVDVVHVNPEQQQQQQQQPIQNVEPIAVAVAIQPQNHDRENNPQQQNPNLNRRNPPTAREVLRNLESHERSNELLFRIARSEVLPLIRAEIDWTLLQSQLSSYPGAEIGDESAAFLLHSILRMDPPLGVIRNVIETFPKSCVVMDPFYAACQYASDDAVKLLMQSTMKARILEGIHWSMLALLGDARIGLQHARFLLKHTPEVVVDPSHGVFDVSPLDRMLSGAFIHGDAALWASKLKLALLTADRGFLDEDGKPFCAYHALLKRLISSGFRGTKFGATAFTNCLSACINGESGHPFHEINEDANLPLHIVLGSKCNTKLGTIGERKLVKFLVRVNPLSTVLTNSDGISPIRLAIQNGWPVYDIIMNRCPEYYKRISSNLLELSEDVSESEDKAKSLLIHDALKGPYHPRFGIHGARTLVKFMLDQFPGLAEAKDASGCYPIHIAIKNSWPCHDLIASAAPFTLEAKDTNGMYPYQIAAYANSASRGIKIYDSTRLSILFELIRESPLLLEDRFGGGGCSLGLGDEKAIQVPASAGAKRSPTTVDDLDKPPMEKKFKRKL